MLLVGSVACQFFPFARVHLRFRGVAILALLGIVGGDLLCGPTSPDRVNRLNGCLRVKIRRIALRILRTPCFVLPRS